MKVSIITVVYNGEKYIKDCIESILAQDYPQIELIVIDGASIDSTVQIIQSYQNKIHHFISEPDNGMYDALNKGIKLATGDIIGALNADDTLATKTILTEIVAFFKKTNADGIYGNLNYVNAKNTEQIVRKWRTKQHLIGDFSVGWMPAHPTLYLKKELFYKYGNYSLNYGTAGDYELMLRFLYKFKIKALFLNKLIVNMRTGGVSNSSFKQRYLAFVNDYSAAKHNTIPIPLLTIVLKKISKITQFLHSN
ncbi:glycosyltransferase family 2 protein [Pedobacter cryotolerans]|uniref:Glycosyltransferase n=1 Tax=Pedobacter cryotolerans TaxID=2571270 RepID=A0A4U1BYK5_9SPHI|nr:glycosyltransferase family 2 protein [Pedobacter cryotolerans]TKB98249.1 glycosyltransferase [Pedobacter cryotolerans]